MEHTHVFTMQYNSQKTRMFFEIISILLLSYVVLGEAAEYENLLNRNTEFQLAESQIRFSRLRCSQLYPRADALNFSDTPDTHCFVECLLYKMGLMNLTTRGLDSYKFLDIWDDIEEAFEEKCMDKFVFDEPLNGKCSESYRKFMEFRTHCQGLFEFTFGLNSTWKSQESSKSVGQSASEFCDSLDGDDEPIVERSHSLELTFLSHYKSQLECLYQNYHYLDAYGRVDEAEIFLSYQEVHMDDEGTKATIQKCAHRANSKFQKDDGGELVFELQTCLKEHSPGFSIVSQKRDEQSREY